MKTRIIATHLLITTALMTSAPTMDAQSFEISRRAFFTQTSSDPPVAADRWYFSGSFVAESPGQATSVTLIPPTGSPLEESGDQFHHFFTPGFHSAAALEAVFPPGDYRFTVTTGSQAGESAVVTWPATPLYPSSVPFLTGDTFERLASYDPSVPFTFTWNQLEPNAASNWQFVDFFIRPTELFSNVGYSSYSSSVAGFTSATVPAGTLQPNTEYRAVLVFSNGQRTSQAGFDSFASDAEAAYFTDVTFVTDYPAHAGHAIYRFVGHQTVFGNGRITRGSNNGYLVFEPDTRRGTEIVAGVIDRTNKVFAIMPFQNHRVDQVSGPNGSTYTIIAQAESSNAQTAGTLLQAVYLRGRDGTVSLGPKGTRSLPRTWRGWSREIAQGDEADSIEGSESSGTYTLQVKDTVTSNQTCEIFEAAVVRLANKFVARGYRQISLGN